MKKFLCLIILFLFTSCTQYVMDDGYGEDSNPPPRQVYHRYYYYHHYPVRTRSYRVRPIKVRPVKVRVPKYKVKGISGKRYKNAFNPKKWKL